MSAQISKREVVSSVINGNAPAYVPWSFRFTVESIEKLESRLGPSWEEQLDNHFMELGSDIGFFDQVGANEYQDLFGVVWDRTVEKDIGMPANKMLATPSLDGYSFPDPRDERFFRDVDERIARDPDRYRVFCIGFSLYERAWSLRGMTELLMDFYENPQFVHDLFEAIVDYNTAQVRRALEHDIDAVYFGDDWGQQTGLIMGPDLWREFLYPHLKRMYAAVRDAGKAVLIHSCGDVDELFPDLIDIGVCCFNPFQPEVMDTISLLENYRGRLSFWGGLSTQQTLPFGDEATVREESRRLLSAGESGGYIFSPAHAVEGDVPIENIMAFVEEAHAARAAAL